MSLKTFTHQIIAAQNPLFSIFRLIHSIYTNILKQQNWIWKRWNYSEMMGCVTFSEEECLIVSQQECLSCRVLPPASVMFVWVALPLPAKSCKCSPFVTSDLT